MGFLQFTCSHKKHLSRVIVAGFDLIDRISSMMNLKAEAAKRGKQGRSRHGGCTAVAKSVYFELDELRLPFDIF